MAAQLRLQKSQTLEPRAKKKKKKKKKKKRVKNFQRKDEPKIAERKILELKISLNKNLAAQILRGEK